MEFEIGEATLLKVEDIELTGLLMNVYVAGGYTPADEAATLFEATAVRTRGLLIAAREKQNLNLAGIVIMVPPDSPARRLAQNNEAEIHLLGVNPLYRRHGLGRMLILSAIDKAKQNGYSKIILWTQISMVAAQKLYETTGFIHTGALKKNDRDFKVYSMALSD